MSEFAQCEKGHSAAEIRPLLDGLIESVEGFSVARRERMLERAANLFLAGSRRYSDQQIAVFDDVLLQLSSDIEMKARAKLAGQIAGVKNAPPKLVRSLAFDDEIEVAAPVLSCSEQLTEDDLVENARTKSQKHLLAIAQRLKLSEAVTDVLVERGNKRVVQRVAENRGARFSLAGYEGLTVRAYENRRLALALSARSDLPRQYFIKLLENAAASVRSQLEAINPQAATAIGEAVDEVASTMQQEVRQISQEFAAAKRDARIRFRAHAISEANVHAPARAQEFEKVLVSLARLGGYPLDLVERALLDEGGDMLLILAKAANCSWTTVRELLRMQAAGRKLTADDVSEIFDRYHKLTSKTARRILSFRTQRMKLRARSGSAHRGGQKMQANRVASAAPPRHRAVASE
jgi:uncharacterized protein (DUF2336 family)